jgi:Tol biopolymer transport system component
MNRLAFVIVALGLVATSAATAARSKSPDATKVRNGMISFWSDRAFGGRAQVFVMNPNGSRQRRLTELFSAKRGDFSFDGRKLVLDGRAYDTLFDFDIFVMNADGSGIRRLTQGPERDTNASWSPDGRFVSFAREKSENSLPSLWVVRADGSDAHRVTDGFAAAWSPDGKRLAVGGLQLATMRPDGTGKKAILRGESEAAAWSRDGRRILFTAWRDGNAEVYVVRSDGSKLRRLTRHPGEDFAADFSPDGRKVLFTSDRRGWRQVYVMNLDGSGVRNLSRSRTSDWATSWQALT